MLKLPKAAACVSSQGKPEVKCDEEEKGPVAVNSQRDGSHEGKPQHEQTDETSHTPSCTDVTKPGAANASAPSLEKTSSLPGPGLGKITYNPITHAPSKTIYLYTAVLLAYFLGYSESIVLAQ